MEQAARAWQFLRRYRSGFSAAGLVLVAADTAHNLNTVRKLWAERCQEWQREDDANTCSSMRSICQQAVATCSNLEDQTWAVAMRGLQKSQQPLQTMPSANVPSATADELLGVFCTLMEDEHQQAAEQSRAASQDAQSAEEVPSTPEQSKLQQYCVRGLATLSRQLHLHVVAEAADAAQLWLTTQAAACLDAAQGRVPVNNLYCQRVSALRWRLHWPEGDDRPDDRTTLKLSAVDCVLGD